MLAGQSPSSGLLDKGSSQAKNSGLRNSKDLGVNKQNSSQITSKSQNIQKKKKRKKKNETQFTSVLKFFNIVMGVLIIGFAVYCYIGLNTDDSSKTTLDFINLILPGYIAFSGLIILSIECNIKFMVRNMKFLYNYFGRGIFNIYVGILPLTLIRQGKDDKGKQQDSVFQILIYIMVCLICLIGVMYILAKICCCARQSQKRKRTVQSSDSSSDDD